MNCGRMWKHILSKPDRKQHKKQLERKMCLSCNRQGTLSLWYMKLIRSCEAARQIR